MYQNADGTYSYVVPVPGDASGLDIGEYNPTPLGTTKAGLYHTHGGYDPEFNGTGNPQLGQPGYNWKKDGNEIFSPQDLEPCPTSNVTTTARTLGGCS